MNTQYTTKVISLLQSIESGNKASLEELYDITYQEIKNIARSIKVSFQGQHTLNTTALVHEAYLKIEKAQGLSFNSKAHYLGTVGKAIRHIIVNYIHQKNAQKRGSQQVAYSLEDWHEPLAISESLGEKIMDLHEALNKLALEEEEMARIIEARFFANMSTEEIAQMLAISPSTVKRKWNKAKVWLYRQLQQAS